MSEAEKKNDGGGATGGNVKPFPDFIVSGPGAPNAPPPPAAASSSVAAPPPAAPAPPAMTPAPPVKPPRARGGGWAFLFALVSLSAAGVSLSAPSLRPIAAEQLKQQFGDRPWIGILTGTADTRPPSVVELDLQQFDARLQALAVTLTAANPGAPVDAETLARFADAAGATRRMDEFEAALNRLKAGEGEQITAMSQALARMETALDDAGRRAEAAEGGLTALGEQLQAVETRTAKAVEIAELADTGAKEVATTLGGVLPKLAATEAGLADLSGRLTAVGAQTAEQIAAALSALNTDLDARFGGVDRAAAEAAAQAAAALEGLRHGVALTAGHIAGLGEAVKAAQALATAQEQRLTILADESKNASVGIAAAAVRLNNVEQAVTRQRGATGAALLGVSNRLRLALDEGEPFAAELAALKALTANDPAFAAPVAVLTPLAERGAPGLSYLRREFNVAARKIVEAEEAAQPAWYARQLSNVQYYLGWGAGATPAAPVNGESARTVLAQAATAINAGNFGEAAGAVATLQGASAESAQPWLAAARARVTAEQAVRALNLAALERVGR